jgi:hypothetical protein
MAILGHFIGDYLLQPVPMAIGKSKPGWEGAGICTLHCLVYSLVVTCMATGTANPSVFGMVFLSHFPIDRWNLGQKWLDLIGGRNVKTDWRKARVEAHGYSLDDLHLPVVTMAFAAIVYTVTDNTLHILLMYIGFLTLRFSGLV